MTPADKRRAERSVLETEYVQLLVTSLSFSVNFEPPAYVHARRTCRVQSKIADDQDADQRFAK
jgi:hypothetical protein